MEEFLRFVIGHLVEFPDEIAITRTDLSDKVIFHVAARPTDIPKITGRSGHTIQALRSLLSASAKKHGIQAALEIIE